MKSYTTISVVCILGLFAAGFISPPCKAALPDRITGLVAVDEESYGINDALQTYGETLEDLGEASDRLSVGRRMAAVGSSNPLGSVSVSRVNGAWQAQLDLAADVDELRGTLNGQRVTYLFRNTRKGTQVVRLAPDDGLRFGRNVLKVFAVYHNSIYPTQVVAFSVDRTRPLTSAGRDRRVRLFEPVQLDGRRSLHLSAMEVVHWRIVRAPAGSQVSLLGSDTLQPSFTPDVNGNYQIELTVRDRRKGAVGRDTMTTQVLPNYPPIGVGIETMAQQNDGGYAIVLGTNCTAEIKGCPPNATPGQVKTFPYGSDPVQLVILDRQTLEVRFNETYGSSQNDFFNAFSAVYSKAYGVPIIVILAALPNNEINSDFQYLIQDLVSQPTGTGLRWQGNNGGWSVIGVPQPYTGPGPYGHLNPGTGPVPSPDLLGNLKGYLQYNETFIPGSKTARYDVYNFTLGDYVSFNTSANPVQSLSNVIVIGENSYSSQSLGACSGGFQLVVLDAATLNPPAHMPGNQTFPTNCGDDGSDQQEFDNLANALATTTLSTTTPSTIEGGAVVFLQSIGVPISARTAVQQYAAQHVSPYIEALGGVADAFNKSMLQSQQSGNPGYALASSTYLFEDAPLGVQTGVYAPEASGAATGMTVGTPVFLEGMLKRNYLWRYTPVAGASVNANPGLLPTVAYQPATAWPTGGPDEKGEKNALIWFSDTLLQLHYTSDSVCYTPAYHNVRALYCANNVKYSGGEGWSNISNALDQRFNKIPYPKTGCNCTTDEWQKVYDSLSQETANVSYVRAGINNLMGLYGTSSEGGQVQLKQVTSNVLSALSMTDSTATIAGFWTEMAASILGGLASGLSVSNPVVAAGIGVASGMAWAADDLMTSGNGESDLGQILQTTAAQLPQELQNRYVIASNLIANYGDMILSDYGKLSTLGANLIFQTDWSNDASVEASLTLGAQRFAYGKLLGGVYTSYGLLPDSQNPDYPSTPAAYVCNTGWTDPTAVAPFGDAQSGAWIDLTRPNFVGTLPAYGGAPNVLVLGFRQGDWSYSSPPNAVMNSVFTSTTSGGVGEWPIWFFRHNFQQAGYVCANQ
jgi:hypothetical protein